MPHCLMQPNVFTPAECQQIIAYGEGNPMQEGSVTVKDKPDAAYGQVARLRRCKVAWFGTENKPILWALERVRDAMRRANGEHWQFNTDGEWEYAQFTRYGVEDHFGWHMDLGDGRLSLRKLTGVVFLNPPEQYQGGQLQIQAHQEVIEPPQLLGALFVFPAYILHRVTPVTQGTRFSLVQWLCGREGFK